MRPAAFKILRSGPLALVAALAVSPAFAQESANYCAKLGAQDHVSSRGVRLTTIGAIIQQDRANFHKFNRRDPEDESDPIFSNKASRDTLNRRIDESELSPVERSTIIDGTPIVCVTIEGDQAHITSIR